MNAIEFLQKGHRKIERLLAELDRTYDERTFAELKTTLVTHAKIEEELFYPVVRGATIDTAALVDSAMHDHHSIDEWIDDIDPASAEEIGQLRRALATHIDMEEQEIFREAQRGLDDADLERIGREMKVRLEELAPRGPDGKRANREDEDMTFAH